MHNNTLFQTEKSGDTVIVVPLRDMGEFEMASMDAEEAPPFEQLVQLTDGHNVVVDLSQTDYFGSSTIGLFNRLVAHVRSRSRRIAFCNLSPHEREVIDITHVDRFWDVKDSREAALEFVSEAASIRSDKGSSEERE